MTPSEPTPTQPPSTEAPETVDSPLVGEWVGLHDCDRIVAALRAAGFGEAVVIENVVGNGLVPGVTSVAEIVDAPDPCADAVPREHSHFFTASGEFGSRDFNGEQVDDGRYEIIDEDTVRINGTDFDFSIQGDLLTLEPTTEDGCLDFQCQWSIMVAMAGEPLGRVD